MCIYFIDKEQALLVADIIMIISNCIYWFIYGHNEHEYRLKDVKTDLTAKEMFLTRIALVIELKSIKVVRFVTHIKLKKVFKTKRNL